MTLGESLDVLVQVPQGAEANTARFNEQVLYLGTSGIENREALAGELTWLERHLHVLRSWVLYLVWHIQEPMDAWVKKWNNKSMFLSLSLSLSSSLSLSLSSPLSLLLSLSNQ